MAGTGIQVKLKPRHPGKFIHTKILEELGLDTAQTAQMLGVDEQSFAALVDGKTRLTPEMALRIEKAFAISMELQLRLQAWYDTEQMRARWDEVEVQVFDWDKHLAKAAGGKGETGEGVAPQAGFEPAT